MKPDQIVLQSGADPTLSEGEPSELRDTPLDATRSHTYVTAEEAADYLRFPSAAAFRLWLQRHPGRLKTFRLGRELRFRARDLDSCLQPVGEPETPFGVRHLSSHRRRRA